MQKTNTAFTLAEVLIVLAIIGVVSVITIPALIQKTQNLEYVTALKKFYSEGNQALAQTAIEEGTPGKLGAENTVILTSDIANHFKKIKECGYDENAGCWSPVNNKFDNTGDTYYWDADTGEYKFITADGMSVMILSSNAYCKDIDDTDANAPRYNKCGVLWVDVNGPKKPNVMGRDVFGFVITSNKAPLLAPYGGNGDWKTENECQTDSTWGWHCAGRVIEEGWQMNY